MTKNLETAETNNFILLKDVNTNEILVKISINEYMSKDDAITFINDIKKHINIKQANEIQEKMKKVDEMMQKCGYQLDALYKLYDECDDKFEKELIYAEIRSIEILNSIRIEANK